MRRKVRFPLILTLAVALPLLPLILHTLLWGRGGACAASFTIRILYLPYMILQVFFLNAL